VLVLVGVLVELVNEQHSVFDCCNNVGRQVVPPITGTSS
jgi:hypothetical protein